MGDSELHLAPDGARLMDDARSVVPLIPGEQQLDIHRPKPVHSWRELVGEIGVIVIGVLIALGGEQAVEALHWAHVVHESEAAMRLELRRDDLPQAYTRDAITPCLAAQLSQLRLLSEPGQSAERFHEAALRFSPPDRTWTANALKASQNALAGHIAPADVLAWNLAYDMVPFLQRAADREQDALRELRRSNFAEGKLTSAQVDRLSDALDDLETAGRTQQSDAQTFQVEAALAGIELTADARDRLEREARDIYGNCVTPSDLAVLRRAMADEQIER